MTAALRILLADDVLRNRDLVLAMLKQSAHVVDIAINGEEAVRKFTSSIYDLVLMDVQMPRMDGYAATREIRRWEREERRTRTPIVALTAHSGDEEVQRSRDAGCDSHLAKPINIAEFRAMIAQFAAAVSVDSSAGTLGAADATEGATGAEASDATHGLQRITIRVPQEIAHLVPDFLASVRADTAAMHVALEMQSFDRIRRYGHDCSSGGSYGFDAISAIGGAIEAAARTMDSETIRRCLSELDDYLARVDVVIE